MGQGQYRAPDVGLFARCGFRGNSVYPSDPGFTGNTGLLARCAVPPIRDHVLFRRDLRGGAMVLDGVQMCLSSSPNRRVGGGSRVSLLRNRERTNQRNADVLAPLERGEGNQQALGAQTWRWQRRPACPRLPLRLPEKGRSSPMLLW